MHWWHISYCFWFKHIYMNLSNEEKRFQRMSCSYGEIKTLTLKSIAIDEIFMQMKNNRFDHVIKVGALWYLQKKDVRNIEFHSYPKNKDKLDLFVIKSCYSEDSSILWRRTDLNEFLIWDFVLKKCCEFIKMNSIFKQKKSDYSCCDGCYLNKLI